MLHLAAAEFNAAYRSLGLKVKRVVVTAGRQVVLGLCGGKAVPWYAWLEQASVRLACGWARGVADWRGLPAPDRVF